MAERFAGRTAIVTGAAAGGLSAAYAEAPAAGGARMAVARSQALRRQAWPEDIVGTVLFRCSPDSDFMTGQVLCVDGGFVAN